MRKLLQLAAQKVGGDTSDMTMPSEEYAPPARAGQQQPPSADYDNADPTAFMPADVDGDADLQEEWPYYGDFVARNELDQFGFLRAEGGVGSLFPAANELDGVSEGQDQDMEDGFPF